MSRTKVVCTLGPASESEGTLRSMLRSGMSVARLNFSHGDHAWHSKMVSRFRKCANAERIEAGLMCDIQGPKIRVGTFLRPIYLKPGEHIDVRPGGGLGDDKTIFVDYPKIATELEPGDTIYVNDGTVKLAVEKKTAKSLFCVVGSGGVVSDRKGVNLPSERISANMPTDKDLRDMKHIARLDPEYLAVSFVRSFSDMERIKKELVSLGNPDIKLVAKIERPSALKDIDKIIGASDAVMVARGDLGVEILAEEVPCAQKDIIAKCNAAGKPCIVATQMLESMTVAQRPTRAEASDVFNAVLDGADAIMLSAETSSGAHPVEAVSTMRAIAENAERYSVERLPRLERHEKSVGAAVAASCGPLASELARLGRRVRIVAVTGSGYSARIVSRHRPPAPIVAIAPDKRTARELSLVWGIDPMIGKDKSGGIEERARGAVRVALRAGKIGKGDLVMAVMTSQRLGKGAMHLAVYEAGLL